VRQFGENGAWREQLPVKLSKDVYIAQEDKVIQRAGIGYRDHANAPFRFESD
jgi:hypothetical protein